MTSFAKSIETQTEEFEQLFRNKPEAFPEWPGGDYVVYGAGQCGQKAARLLGEIGCRTVAFLDAEKSGKAEGLAIHHPESPSALELAKANIPVVLGVFNFAADLWPIVQLLKKQGFQKIVSYHEFHERMALPPHFWLTSREQAFSHQDSWRLIWKLLGDEVSRKVFLDVLRLRFTFDLELLRTPEWGTQYLPHGIPHPKIPLRMIDGGAFTGDTAAYLLENNLPFEALAAFEPDPNNYQHLYETASKNQKKLGDITLWPCGLGEKNKIVRFQSGQGAGSAIAEEGSEMIQLVSLDQSLMAFAPTYIKFDIEGAELAALEGARNLISTHQPSLAICLYHTPDHLWQIPLLIHELLPDHQIAIRYHTFNAYELVVYAFKPEKI